MARPLHARPVTYRSLTMSPPLPLPWWRNYTLLFFLCRGGGSGFITMTPQLFINYKLKSVAHLPWRMLTYKALNTFIDDLFAFVIKMPMMYRIGCLRDGASSCAASASPDVVGEPMMICLSVCFSLLSRCGVLHLPLPALDLPGWSQQGQRVRHQRSRPDAGRHSGGSRCPRHSCQHHRQTRRGEEEWLSRPSHTPPPDLTAEDTRTCEI